MSLVKGSFCFLVFSVAVTELGGYYVSAPTYRSTKPRFACAVLRMIAAAVLRLTIIENYLTIRQR